MLDERILDGIIPVPDIDDKKDEIFAELETEGFVITNKRTGGIFITLIMIALQCYIEIKNLLRTCLNDTILEHASEAWVELKAADFSKQRKLASKTEGAVTVSRDEPGDAVQITKGTVFKTEQDANGDVLKFIATELSILPKDILSVKVHVIAESKGAQYNVAQNQITKCLINLEGIDHITNTADWISFEGSDIETIESLKSRTKLSWSELATLPIADKYKNTCEAVTGVFLAEVDDQHPRGQGTINIYITSSAGAATTNLITLAEKAVEEIAGPYDNVLVQSTETVIQPVTVEIDLPITESISGVVATAESVITELMAIKSGKKLNRLGHTDIIYGIKNKVAAAQAIRVTVPAADIELEKGKILIAGDISVTIRQV